jgi:hypothetical protein
MRADSARLQQRLEAEMKRLDQFMKGAGLLGEAFSGDEWSSPLEEMQGAFKDALLGEAASALGLHESAVGQLFEQGKGVLEGTREQVRDGLQSAFTSVLESAMGGGGAISGQGGHSLVEKLVEAVMEKLDAKIESKCEDLQEHFLETAQEMLSQGAAEVEDHKALGAKLEEAQEKLEAMLAQSKHGDSREATIGSRGLSRGRLALAMVPMRAHDVARFIASPGVRRPVAESLALPDWAEQEVARSREKQAAKGGKCGGGWWWNRS